MMKLTVKIGKVVVLAFAFVIVLFPFLWAVLLSFKDNAEIQRIPATFFPDEWYFEGYIAVLTEAPFATWFMNSVITTFAGTLIVAFTSALAGYIFEKFNFKCKNIIFMIVLATMMVPFQVTMIPVYLICAKLKLLNTLLVLIVPSMVSAFGIFLCRQACANIPNEMIEAGRMEGASEWRVFIQIIVPMLKSSISALCIFTFMGKWNDYLWPLIALNDSDKMTLPLALTYFNSNRMVDYNASMSAAVLVMLPVIVIYAIFQKHFIEGIATSGMK